ncbi:MAG: DHH family phosphoesterase [Promethearchaeota archaeon]|nr:MAG: DHH family phosphoesterase [Candidatus Lokiarchaeota archaeon]
MSNFIEKYNQLDSDLDKLKDYFLENVKEINGPIQIFTHLDSDGLSAGAILGKALFREDFPFKITVLKQLEREEIVKISEETKQSGNFIIFSDFGSGQYKVIEENITNPFIILDHHLPYGVSDKEKIELLKEIYKNTKEWHINPYFYGIDGSEEISGSGMSYLFAKKLDEKNSDLSVVALIGASGDVQNQGKNKSFMGINAKIAEEAKNNDLIAVVDDINFSPIKPLNKAIAYSSEINLPGLSGDANKTLKFLKQLGILMKHSDGSIKSLMDLNQEEKQKITSAIIEYISIKLDIEPYEIINKLIVNRYLLTSEEEGSDLQDINEFSNLLNACGRTNNASIGIAIAMGDRNEAYKQAKQNLQDYKKSLVNALTWIRENKVIIEMDNIQYFFGDNMIPESIIGTVSSMLIFDESEIIDRDKPIFGYAKRKDEDVYKISARAHKSIVEKGVNLSDAIRKALELTDLIALGGGHPPAAGTKIPSDKIDVFLENCDKVIEEQLNNN